MMRKVLLPALLLFSACGESAETGAGEPFRVRGAQFISGALPSTALEGDLGNAGDGSDSGNLDVDTMVPEVAALESPSLVAYQGQTGKKFSGRVNAAGVAVGLRLKDAGTGYWVVPAGARDPQTKEMVWDATCDFDLGLNPGLTQVELVAFDAAGAAGPKTLSKLCIADRVPDNLNACDSASEPPSAVISLRWDTNVDLDLQVLTEAGIWVDAKRPTLSATEGGEAIVDRDSNGGCAIDGIRYENLVWKTPPSGRFGVYANLSDACGRDAVRFEASVWLSQDAGNGQRKLENVGSRSGELLAVQANGGEGVGLFLFETTF